jgi:hypothetical protein
MLSALHTPAQSKPPGMAQPTGHRWAGTALLLNPIKVLHFRLPKATASLKLPKSDSIGCAIAGVPTQGILAEQKALFERRALHPRPEGRRLYAQNLVTISQTFCRKSCPHIPRLAGVRSDMTDSTAGIQIEPEITGLEFQSRFIVQTAGLSSVSGSRGAAGLGSTASD